MNLLRKIYAETLKDFVDFYRFTWVQMKWYRNMKTLPKLDPTDYFITCIANDLKEDQIHKLRMEAFERRMAAYERDCWQPNWLRWILGRELLNKPVFKPLDRDEVKDTLYKVTDADAMWRNELRLLRERLA